MICECKNLSLQISLRAVNSVSCKPPSLFTSTHSTNSLKIQAPFSRLFGSFNNPFTLDRTDFKSSSLYKHTQNQLTIKYIFFSILLVIFLQFCQKHGDYFQPRRFPAVQDPITSLTLEQFPTKVPTMMSMSPS